MLNGKKTGEWLTLYPEGAVWSRCNYKDGLLDGHVINWDEDARLQTDSVYKAGKLDGLTIAWHTNGQKALETTWRSGVEEGPWKEWNASGQLLGEGNNRAGRLDGKIIRYRDDGSIDASRSGVYSMGNKIADLP